MAKGHSSASSATRKKHAKKAAQAGEPEQPAIPKEKKPKGKEKGSKRSKEPRKKVYIPPTKPVPVQWDPLDTLGIAQMIPAELLIVLRKLAKKDSVTKRRALEDFFADWVEKSRRDGDLLETLEIVLPVWLHHLPVLFLHPQRRLRLSAVRLHAALLGLPTKAKEVAFLLREGTSADQAETILGAWLLAAYDPDVQVSKLAKGSWNTYVLADSPGATQDSTSPYITLDHAAYRLLWEFAERATLDPGGVYLQVNPPQPVAPPPPSYPQRKGGKLIAPLRKGDETPTRVKPEEDEESETDRHARLRMSGFGAMEWILTSPFMMKKDVASRTEIVNSLDNVALWSSLFYGQHAPFLHDEMDSFGWDQPGVRKACWNLLQILLKNHSDCMGGLEQTLSVATLRSAWVEPDVAVRNTMWTSLLLFLKEHPKAWEHEARSQDEIEAVDGEGSDEDVAVDDAPAKVPLQEGKLSKSIAYEEFRQFLELGCIGSPVQSYPAVIIILSTIPSSILAVSPTPVQTFFDSFWAAIDGRALGGLDRAAASAAFLSSLLECMVFIVKRLMGDQGKMLVAEGGDGKEEALRLITEQFKRVWEDISTDKLKVPHHVAAGALSRTLATLLKGGEDLFDAAWSVLDAAVRQAIEGSTSVSSFVPVILKTFQTNFAAGDTKLREVSTSLVRDVLRSSISRFESIIQSSESVEATRTQLQSVVAILDPFADDIFADEELAAGIDKACLEHSYHLLKVSTPVLLVYLSKRKDDALRKRLWRSILQAIGEHCEESNASLAALLQLVESGSVPDSLGPSDGELDSTIGRLLANALSGRAANDQALDTLKRVFSSYQYLISEDCLRGLVDSICETFIQNIQSLLREPDAAETSFTNILSLFDIVVSKNLVPQAIPSILPDLFLFGYLIPLIESRAPQDDTQYNVARSIFHRCAAALEEEPRQDVFAVITQRLRDIIFDCATTIRMAPLLSMLSKASDLLETNLTLDVSPAQPELDSMLKRLPEQPAHVSLAVVDSLVLLSDWEEPELAEVPEFDSIGFSSYARGVLFLLLHHLDDRSVANENIWALRHFQSLSLYAKDLMHASSVEGAVFASHLNQDALEDIVNKVEQVSTYVVSHKLDDGWFSRVLPNLSAGKLGPNADGIERLLHGFICTGDDSIRESRVLHSILRHVLSGATKADADQLLMLARKIEKKVPRIALAIVYSVTQYASEPPRLDRLRNELAADLFGIPASRASSDGLWSLRRLAAVAPDPESDVVYLPTPRAVNLMKACQQWITSDEELDEEVEFQMTTIFFHLAPILQSVPGAHWDLIFDLMENNLENCTFSDPTTLPLLHRTLKLLIAVEELASTNKALRATWEERRLANLKLVQDLAAQQLDSETAVVALSICRELALTVIQDLPEQLIDKDSISKMCHLIMDPSENVPRMSYKILQVSAAKYTEHLVLEASVDNEATVPLNLPIELVELVQSGLQGDDALDNGAEQSLFGHLLVWMLMFDLFTNTSLKVKIGYINDMRRQGLIADYFLPQIFNILGLENGLGKAFKLDMWAVDEFYLDFTAADTPLRVPLLAAHLYYRALRLVPGLVRDWLRDCRDRQLNGAVSTYTSTHFSPVIINAELSQLRDAAAAGADLTDENMSVKVAGAVNEVSAAYTIDEYTLELKLRLPADWPLRPAEVADAPPVGVKEDRWKAWVLGVQQILTFRGGSIVDGISFFKKNIASHFEGQAECAICYSMISAMDGSLAKKPCKTCRNRFHAGCLYKWFDSSHSSSCPLCRSEILH